MCFPLSQLEFEIGPTLTVIYFIYTVDVVTFLLQFLLLILVSHVHGETSSLTISTLGGLFALRVS